MRILPRALWARLCLVLSLAVAAVFVLDFSVKRHDRHQAAAKLPAAPYELEPAPPIRLPAVDGIVRLALRPSSIPDDAAPVVQVLTGGEYAVRRPAPLPTGPVAQRELSPVVVLPSRMAGLDAKARATLADVLGTLVVERPLPIDRFLTLDFRMEVRELDGLLRWVR